jgi:hypothetical protein
MPERSSGERPAGADAVNERLLELLEQVVANQTVQATANLQDEIADRLTAAAWYREGRDRPIPPLGYDQLQLGLRFRAVRNGLGDFGRHGGRDVALLLPAPELDGGTLRFAPLPQDARTVILFRADGKRLRDRQVEGGDTPVIEGVPDVAWVQVDDAHANPLRLGFPRPVPAVGERRRRSREVT